ncbi:MAG: UDP-3-O-(3-hydroxymyristoyl)glucosamine N-acyltransferase [Deltaproteobacteria bacterium]
MHFTLAELANRVGGRVEGDGSIRIERIRPLEEAGPSDSAFFANRRYAAEFAATRAGAVIVGEGEQVAPGRTVLRSGNAYLAFARISTLFHPPRESVPEISPAAVIGEGAVVDPSAEVQALACVGRGATIGARTILFPGVVVGDRARVGDDCVLHPNVVVGERCVVGNRCTLQPGAVLGGDGFGFAFDMEGDGSGPRHVKVPQAGIAELEDDVELGANSCVDRATLGRTVVRRGAKIDNLVQLAHNVEIGPLSLIAAQSGISGSTKVGMGVAMGGQVGLVGHLTIGDGARFGAKAGVHNDVPAGEVYSGYPATSHRDWLRESAAIRALPELVKRVRELEKTVKKLQEAK